ncbi:MAG: hypothetical protein KKH75_01550 [Actinobacteria bacterium]|nr:hypothetical protein [Actinomycetota bacterium]
MTSAAIHGLPVVRCDREGTHTIARGERTGPVKGVIRHRGPVADDDIEEIDWLLCTTLARTVSDVARTARAETSVSITDAAIRRVAFRSVDHYRAEVAAEFRATSAEVARRSSYGTARALRALAFADGRAQLPGESISRLYLVRLGYRPHIQVAVAAPDGGRYFVDFDLGEGVGFGEFDGAGKYTDPAILRGRTPAEAVADEKRREDWIRGTTQRRLARWEKSSLASATALGERLERFGMPPPRN